MGRLRAPDNGEGSVPRKSGCPARNGRPYALPPDSRRRTRSGPSPAAGPALPYSCVRRFLPFPVVLRRAERGSPCWTVLREWFGFPLEPRFIWKQEGRA